MREGLRHDEDEELRGLEHGEPPLRSSGRVRTLPWSS